MDLLKIAQAGEKLPQRPSYSLKMPIALRRLHSHLLANNPRRTPHEVVSHLGAVQAQDYLGALWAVGTRMETATESEVEAALASRSIVRCWPMRGTLHFVAAEDARWMLELLAPRVLARHRPRLQREFELDPKTLRRCAKLVEKALAGGNALTRAELYTAFEDRGIATRDSRGLHILFALAHESLICFGPRKGKQPTFVLLDEWLPATKPKPREEALAELARRYFGGHGPATIADFVWWSGLTMKEAKEAIALTELEHEAIDEQPMWFASVPDVSSLSATQLLPPFDEYTVAYKDRSAIVEPAFATKVNAGGGMINAVVVVDGRVIGNWKRTLRGTSVEITISAFRELTPSEEQAIEREAERYADFLQSSLSKTIMSRTGKPFSTSGSS